MCLSFIAFKILSPVYEILKGSRDSDWPEWVTIGGNLSFAGMTAHNQSIYRTCLSSVIFSARRSYASADLAVVILSVRPSVCHTHALWLIQRTYRQYYYTRWKSNPSGFLALNSGWWATSPSTFNGRSKWPTPLQKSLTSTDFRL